MRGYLPFRIKTGTPITVFIHDILWGIFVVGIISHRYVPLDVSSLWQYALTGGIFIWVRLSSPSIQKKLTLVVLLWGMCEVFLALLQMGHWIPSNNIGFMVTGSFGNPGPLGGFLGVMCAGLIDFVCQQKRSNSKMTPWIFLCMVLFCGVIVSASRAGLLAALIGSSFCLFRNISLEFLRRHKRQATIGVTLLLLAACIGACFLYKLNPFSANGRLFIWHNSLQLMSENPIIGWGTGGWAGKYMQCQAVYFSTHPDSQFAMLADNVTCPYNELLRIGVDYGLIGIFLFIWIIVEIFREQQSVRWGESLKVSLLAFVVFSLFSYPFNVVHMLVLWSFLMAILESRPVIRFSLPKYMPPLLLVLFLCVFIYLYGLYRKSLHDFKYYSYFHNNPDIMFMYAQKENLDIDSKQRSKMLEETAFLFPSSDTYCWLGDDLVKRGISRKAKFYYQIAANMAPVKITPNYKLFKFYLSEGDTIDAINIGNATLKKKIKVDNTKTLQMLGEIEFTISLLCNK